METLGEVKEVVSKVFSIDIDKISDDAHLLDDLNADSLAKMDLVMKLEDQFGIEIPEEDSEKVMTVRAIADYIEQKTQ